MGRTKQAKTTHAAEEKEEEKEEEEESQEPPREEPQEPPRQPTAEEMEQRRRRTQEQQERIQQRYQDSLFRFWNWHRRYPQEEMEVLRDNGLLHRYLWSMENYRDPVWRNLSIEDRLRVLRRGEARANRFSWLLTHPHHMMGLGRIDNTVREYQEHLATNNIHLVQANYSEEEQSDSSISNYFENLRDNDQDIESEQSQDSRRDNEEMSDNNENESESSDSGPEDDNSTDEENQNEDNN